MPRPPLCSGSLAKKSGAEDFKASSAEKNVLAKGPPEPQRLNEFFLFQQHQMETFKKRYKKIRRISIISIRIKVSLKSVFGLVTIALSESFFQSPLVVVNVGDVSENIFS